MNLLLLFKWIKHALKGLMLFLHSLLKVLYLNSRWKHTTIFPKPVKKSSVKKKKKKNLTTIPHIVLQLKPPSQFVTHLSNSTCFVNVSSKNGMKSSLYEQSLSERWILCIKPGGHSLKREQDFLLFTCYV